MNLIVRRKRSETALDMTPLIDVVFQLLIFLLVSTKFMKPETVVDLPSSPAASSAMPQTDRKAMTFAITPEGSIMVKEKIVSFEEVPTLISAHLAEGNLSRAEIRGDRTSHFGVFVKLLEILKGSGLESVAIVKQIEDAPPGTE